MPLSSEKLTRQMIQMSVVTTLERDFDECIAYSKHLQGGSYPTVAPVHALELLETRLVREHEKFRRGITESSRRGLSLGLWTADLHGYKCVFAAQLVQAAQQLREIRNARYGIAPPLAIPFFGSVVDRITHAYSAECRAFIRGHPWKCPTSC